MLWAVWEHSLKKWPEFCICDLMTLEIWSYSESGVSHCKVFARASNRRRLSIVTRLSVDKRVWANDQIVTSVTWWLWRHEACYLDKCIPVSVIEGFSHEAASYEIHWSEDVSSGSAECIHCLIFSELMVTIVSIILTPVTGIWNRLFSTVVFQTRQLITMARCLQFRNVSVREFLLHNVLRGISEFQRRS